MRNRAVQSAVLLMGILLASSLYGVKAYGVEAAAPVAADDLKVRLDKVFAGDPLEGIAELKAMQEHVKALSARVLPATVGVQIGQAWGSGVIISADGYVLTAAHVAGQPNKSARFVLSDGRQVNGKTLGLNRTLDAGLMKITEKGEYPHVEMGASKSLKEGQWCLAVGHPGGYHRDRGLVVRLGRVLLTDNSAVTTDCTLVGGDSGGPLFDMQGKVIGINSRIAGAITANLHVPIDTYHDGWDRLVNANVWGHLPGQEPVLGVSGVRGRDDAKIGRVVRDSPADKAGLKEGDIVVKLGDEEITTFPSLKKAVLNHQPGEEVAVQLKRGDREKAIELLVKLGRQYEGDD